MPASGVPVPPGGEAMTLSIVTGVGQKGQAGEAVAAALARRGDMVVLVSRSEQEVRARATDLLATGARVSAYGCDLSEPGEVERLATQVKRDHGERLDVLVNLAGGFASSGPIDGSEPGTFDRMIAINARTAYLATRAFFPMLKNAGGSVIFVASDVVIEGTKTSGVAAYAASKAAVVALMRAVADEGREFGVRANALAPGAIRTVSNEGAMGKDARYVEREDFAAVIAFLASPAAKAITGQVIRLR